MARSITAISDQLFKIKGRVKMRKQSDLRECNDLAISLLTVLRAYQIARKSGFKRESVEKVDKAVEAALV